MLVKIQGYDYNVKYRPGNEMIMSDVLSTRWLRLCSRDGQIKNDLPTDLRSFWSFRDELDIEYGVLFKEKQVMIPERMRGTILSQLHKGERERENTFIRQN